MFATDWTLAALIINSPSDTMNLDYMLISVGVAALLSV
jgi:hypothetical protein